MKEDEEAEAEGQRSRIMILMLYVITVSVKGTLRLYVFNWLVILLILRGEEERIRLTNNQIRGTIRLRGGNFHTERGGNFHTAHNVVGNIVKYQDQTSNFSGNIDYSKGMEVIHEQYNQIMHILGKSWLLVHMVKILAVLFRVPLQPTQQSIFPFSLPPSTAWKLFPTTVDPTDDDLCHVDDIVSLPTVPIITSPTSIPPIQRRSQRTSNAPLWMKDYVAVVQNIPSTSKP
ncbi:hypothetical protein H5410_006451 [Solanum commersonii]|uniref:Uncharacterized protein n=1 Tax=Solanum commersonii TaxID=4109 RepID=A0A9J6A9R6_SOLCO|nr:hypothetical protein H5410_006451 [Solanum commersonii]